MKTSTLAVIAIHSDTLRHSVQALLASMPQIKSVQHVEDMASLSAVLQTQSPGVIVLDVDLAGAATPEALNLIGAHAPRARVVLLIDHPEQQQALLNHPIDLVLLKGYRAAELFASIERLLSQAERGEDQ